MSANDRYGAQTEVQPVSNDAFPKLLLQHAARQPDRIALRRKRFGIWQTYTWRQYAEHVRDVAFGLAELGVGAGDRVVILADNEPEWLFSELAVQSLGAVPLGLYADTPAGPMRELVDFAGARLLVAGDQQQVDKILEVRDQMPELETVVYSDPKGLREYRVPGLLALAEVIQRGRQIAANSPDRFAERVGQVDGGALGILLTTSGTSGMPKLAMHAHRSLVLAAETFNRLDARRPDDEHVSYLPLAWAGEQISIALALVVGMPVNFPEEPETAMTDLREISPTHMFGPPRVWEGIAARVLFDAGDTTPLKRRVFDAALAVGLSVAGHRLTRRPVPAWLRAAHPLAEWLVFRAVRDRAGLRRLRYAYTGGASLGSDYLKLFGALGINLKQVYGLTEGGCFFTCHRDGDVRADTVGQPLEGVELRIAESGEILARAPTHMLGYYQNLEATAGAFADGWLRTGDSGSLSSDGHLVVVDRLADIAQLADGTKFSPLLLENKLKFSPYVQEAVVCGDGRAHLCALVTIDGETTGKWAERRRLSFTSYTDLTQKPEIHDLLRGEIARVNREIPDTLRIRRYLVLPKEFDADDEELTRTRKVRRRAIHQRYGDLVVAMFEGAQDVESAITFRYEDGSQHVLKVPITIQDVPAG
jgi:long-chain acyl-CoA synthetase